jgi:putative NIF3 family GTP cyclohydrolase 1 type 2
LSFTILEENHQEVVELIQTLQDLHYLSIATSTPGLYKIECTVAEALQASLKQMVQPFLQSGSSSHPVLDKNTSIGSGMIGELAEPMKATDFLYFLKERMQTDCIKYTQLLDQPIQKVALCGGAGGFLLQAAIRQQANIFITADYKYHEYFDADGQIIIADIGHFESEQFTIPLLKEIISNKFSNFAVYSTAHRTNPVSYFV